MRHAAVMSLHFHGSPAASSVSMTRMALSVVFNGDRAANTPARSSAACSFSGVNLKSQAETNPCAIGSPSGIVIAIRSLPGAVLLAGKLPSSRGTSREANDSSESFLFTCRSSLIGSLFTSRSGGAVQPPSGRCAAGGAALRRRGAALCSRGGGATPLCGFSAASLSQAAMSTRHRRTLAVSCSPSSINSPCATSLRSARCTVVRFDDVALAIVATEGQAIPSSSSPHTVPFAFSRG